MTGCKASYFAVCSSFGWAVNVTGIKELQASFSHDQMVKLFVLKV